MTGKLLGLGAAGLLQISVWMSLALVVTGKALSALPFHASSAVWSLVFYVLGFLFFGVLLMGTGSLGQNLKESQQYGMIWSLGSVVPMMFMSLLVTEPNGTLARVLSFIPLTAPATMFLRLHSIDPPAWWETALSALLLGVSAWVALKLMAKLFRVGLLLYGKRPTIPEILKHLRRPA
jgi:ABC-2 type transport system permease protein